MNLHCRYHPTRTPVLICSKCSNTVCPDCVPNWPQRGMPRCINCRSEMEPLGISQYINPFWRCFNRFFKFPFKSRNLSFILFSVFLFLLIPFPDAKEMVTPLGFIFRIIVWILFPSFIVAYFSAVAIKASDGNPEPPSMAKVWTDGGFLIFFKAMVIVVLFTLITAFSNRIFGAGVEIALTLLATLAFPASLILLFLEREISTAISPARISQLMSAIGFPYLFLWGLVMMLTSGPEIVDSLPESFHQSIIFPTIAFLANLYFGLVLFHMLGYVVYQYHYELGVALPGEEFEGVTKKRSIQKATVLEAELLIMEGKYYSASDLLQKFIDERPAEDPALELVWLKQFELAQIVFDKTKSNNVTEDYIHYLILRGQSFKVVAILRKIHQKKPQFKLSDFSSPVDIEKFLKQEKEFELLNQIS